MEDLLALLHFPFLAFSLKVNVVVFIFFNFKGNFTSDIYTLTPEELT